MSLQHSEGTCATVYAWGKSCGGVTLLGIKKLFELSMLLLYFSLDILFFTCGAITNLSPFYVLIFRVPLGFITFWDLFGIGLHNVKYNLYMTEMFFRLGMQIFF